MIAAVTLATSRVNQGKCPHGMPMGACPICNGQQGGGGGATKATTKSNEMSWGDCYAMGLVMKAQAQNVQDAKQFQMDSLLQSMAQSKFIQAVARQVNMINSFVQANIVQPVTNFTVKVANAVMRPVKAMMNMIANSAMMKGMQNAANFVKQGMANISDKLAAVIGEPMTAVSNFLSENWRKFKLKKFIFFEEVDASMEQGESDEEVELKRLLSLKNVKENINKFFKVTKRNNAWR